MSALPLIALCTLFAAGTGIVWWAGIRLPEVAADLGRRTGMGQAFAGMLLLGGITSLPELATTTSAAVSLPDLALNNAMGSVAFNVVLLAIADAALGGRALTGILVKSVTLLQGVLGMLLLCAAAILLTIGDVALPAFGVGIGSSLLFLLCIGAMWISGRYENRSTWAVIDPPQPGEREEQVKISPRSSGMLVARLAFLALLILVGGVVLSQTGGAIAERTGLGTGLVGMVLLAAATSLPEVSTVTVASRAGQHELAVGDVFGANLFNVAMIFIIDAVSLGEPVLGTGTSFEIVAALLGAIMIGVFVVGLLERADRTVLRVGYDSAAVLLIYASGIIILSQLT